MPIKLPKGFQKRKSSTSALEELPNPPEPSFRVFERPEGTKSFDGGNNLKRRSHGRPLSAGHLGDDERLFADGRPNINTKNRSSGGTNNSTSSGGQNDNSSSSARFSSTSTLPSSTDMPLDENSYTNSKGSYDIPAPPVPEPHHSALRAAGRAFSFGRKKTDSFAGPPHNSRHATGHAHSEPYVNSIRPRAMTESSYASGSTATPPKLLDSDLNFDDGFGSMFESFGKRQSKVLEEPPTLGGVNTESPESMSPAGTRMLTKSYFDEPRITPSPTQLDRPREAQESPQSWASDDSQKRLIGTSRQRAADTLAYYSNTSAPFGAGAVDDSSKSSSTPLSESAGLSSRRQQQRPPSVNGGGLQRSSVHASRNDSSRDPDHQRDEDAKLVLDSLRASRRLNRQFGTSDSYKDEAYNPAASLIVNSSNPSSPYTYANSQKMIVPNDRQHSSTPVFDSSDRDFSATSWRLGSNESTPRARKSELALQEERSIFDVSPPPSGRSASKATLPQAQPLPKPDTQNKIMTPAQFDRYRKEQESRLEQYIHKDDSDEEGDDYEDDDEVERNKQLARERRKQEAHLAVYRQQMMKVTGEQPSDLPSVRPGIDRSSMSAPNLANRSDTPTFSFDKPAEAGKTSDDEDEDVPLGVLAAHGFPSKNKPPTASSSHVKYKSESYPPPPMSTAGTSVAGGPRPLPPFAKHLPQDPYYGAGLVNPSNRESLAYGHGGPASVAGSSRPIGAPGGLVGVIAGEERARAARRGSPNAQGNYGSPLPPGMQMGMPSMMSLGEQATVQMSEQMNQMMQMQMQWMQQMQQMMAGGMQGVPPGQQPPFVMPSQQQQMMMMNTGMLAPPGQTQRPISAPGPPVSAQEMQQRAMSMMNPTSAPTWQPQVDNRMSHAPSMMSGALKPPGPSYAPSLAPSERSNVGLPGRYRPVSIAPTDEHGPRATSRSSTFTSGTLLPRASGRDSRLSTSGDRQSKLSLRPVAQVPPRRNVSDDDDEEGWEEMKQKREQKKSTWRSKKQKEDNGGLDLYDYPGEA